MDAHPKLLRSLSAVDDPANYADGSEHQDGDDYRTARSDHLGSVFVRQRA